MTSEQHDQEPNADAVFEPVGYQWRGSTWCPLDLIMHMAATGGVLTVDIREGESVEQVLRNQAQAMGAAYDPEQFPRPIERNDPEAGEFCDGCDRLLSDEPHRFADNM